MESLQDNINEYRIQLEKGIIRKAYKGLMEYIMSLRTHFQKNYPGYFVSSSVYFGTMDMTYFAFFPDSIKNRKLKVAIVFLHEPFRFEVWLAGYNKQVQSKFWKMFSENDWNKYPLVPTIKSVDSIIEVTLVENPDFNDLESLTRMIESGTLKFIQDVESFLAGKDV